MTSLQLLCGSAHRDPVCPSSEMRCMCCSIPHIHNSLAVLQRQAITDNPEWAFQRRRSRATAERSRASLADQSARAGSKSPQLCQHSLATLPYHLHQVASVILTHLSGVAPLMLCGLVLVFPMSCLLLPAGLVLHHPCIC